MGMTGRMGFPGISRRPAQEGLRKASEAAGAGERAGLSGRAPSGMAGGRGISGGSSAPGSLGYGGSWGYSGRKGPASSPAGGKPSFGKSFTVKKADSLDYGPETGYAMRNSGRAL